MLEQEFKYFDSNRDQLIKGHENQYIIIYKNKVLGYYDNEVQAIKETLKTHELGTFFVNKCIPRDQDIQKYHSRVAFS
jgi:hypothetical protein